MARKPPSPPEREGARAVGRVLRVLELIAGEREPLRLIDIARALELPTSSTHALLQQLVRYEYVRPVGPERRYMQGPGLALLGSRVLSGLQLVRLARPAIEELAAATGENVYLGVCHSRGIAYADSVEAATGLMARFPMGAVRPLHASGPGKLYLAFGILPGDLDAALGSSPLQAFTACTITDRARLRLELADIRSQGYALNEQESVEDLFGVSAPVFGPNDAIIGCIALGMPGVRYRAGKEGVIEKVIATAIRITRLMGNDHWRGVIDRHRKPALELQSG